MGWEALRNLVPECGQRTLDGSQYAQPDPCKKYGSYSSFLENKNQQQHESFRSFRKNTADAEEFLS